MHDIGELIITVYELFCIEFNLYGFVFSLWQVFCFSFVVSIICYIIREVLHNGE